MLGEAPTTNGIRAWSTGLRDSEVAGDSGCEKYRVIMECLTGV